MSLKAFLNPVKAGKKEIEISKRFVNEDGRPEKWIIKPISEEENDEIRKASADLNGDIDQTSRNTQYMYELCAACTVYPNLKDKELQDTYGAMGESELLKKMLLPGEYTRLVLEVTKINDFDTKFDKLVEEAKN